MRILMISWEYPPVIVGGLGQHVGHLATSLARQGHEVVVLSRQAPSTQASSIQRLSTQTSSLQTLDTQTSSSTASSELHNIETVGLNPIADQVTDRIVHGVRVLAVAEDPIEVTFQDDLLAWTLAMGHAMIRAGIAISTSGTHTTNANRTDNPSSASDGAVMPDMTRGHTTSDLPWVPEVVHAHDWLVAHPAIALAQYYDVPLVATLHASEAGRHSGWLSGRLNRQIHSVEWWLANDADSIIACSESMQDEITQLYGPNLAAITVIRNGIDTSAWKFQNRLQTGNSPLLLSFGRLEYEKGFQDAIAALPRIRARFPGTKLAIAGEGTQIDWFKQLARKHRVARSVKFLGHLERLELLKWLHKADVVVLPSRYEPFGIAALEAAATGAPLVVATVGGLAEAVVPSVTGISFPPGDVPGLAAAVSEVLEDPTAAQVRAVLARTRLTREFSWNHVAQETSKVYAAAKRRIRQPLSQPMIPQQPLPERHID